MVFQQSAFDFASLGYVEPKADESDTWDHREFIDGLRGVIGLDPLYASPGSGGTYSGSMPMGGEATGTRWSSTLGPGCYRVGAAGRWCSGAYATRDDR